MEKILKSIEQMELTSDLFFSVVLEDKEVCQEVVSLILGKKIEVLDVQYQHTVLNLVHHSIRIDVLACDAEGSKIGIEMHPQSNEDRVKRTRYNLACIDVNTLNTGEKYIELPDAVHIYITQADFLKTGKGINQVERKIIGTNIEVSNGIQEYYVSLGKDGDTIGQTKLLQYMQHSKGIVESEYFPKLVARVRMLKEEHGGRVYMCEIMDKLMAESEALGEARGEARGIIETLQELGVPKEKIVDKLINKLKITVEEALGYFAVE